MKTRPFRQRKFDPRSTRKWRELRLRILRRDLWCCRYCGGQATQVDHVVPLMDGGAMWDERNLAAACGPCNLARRPAWVRAIGERKASFFSAKQNPMRTYPESTSPRVKQFHVADYTRHEDDDGDSSR